MCPVVKIRMVKIGCCDSFLFCTIKKREDDQHKAINHVDNSHVKEKSINLMRLGKSFQSKSDCITYEYYNCLKMQQLVAKLW